jgi:hypothetical protein
MENRVFYLIPLLTPRHPLNIYTFGDANHTGNVVTRRFHAGILLPIQNAPICGSVTARAHADINFWWQVCDLIISMHTIYLTLIYN